ncbi:MAG: IS1182 family transposase, partial [Candidatus Cloacimonetes bacterium]|nr:IS1182 family transposase [Candidatus Cloacimonadota bacterium]
MHIQADCRYQMIQCCLDDIIAHDNPVRALDEAIDLVFERGKIKGKTGHSSTGRPAYAAKDLAKLMIYGYINGVTTCRKLADEAAINKELAWLIRNQVPSYKTISNFRKDNEPLIAAIFIQMQGILKEMGLITNQTWVIDGNKTKANAKRDMESVKNLQKQIESLSTSLEESFKELDSLEREKDDSDDGDTGSPTNSGTSRNKEDIQQEIFEKQELLNSKQKLLDRANELGKSYISATDEDANLLTTRRGKCAAYNVQYVADAAHHFIVGARATNDHNDKGLLFSTINHVIEITGSKPQQILADAGYTNYQDIKRLTEEVTDEVYVSTQRSVQDAYRDDFKFDRATGTLCCPGGRAMRKKCRRFAKGTNYDVYIIDGCKTCKLCTYCAKGKDNKMIHISENFEFIGEYNERIKQPEIKALLSKRKTIIEHIFGTIAQMMHFNGFKLRGKQKVGIETYLYAIAYNFKRLFSILRSGS